ncbi:hypothetical protein CSIV_12685 [Microbacterium sp. CSI-V]|uniref:hypothetical protein n=1 Tax=unclassified Microbacterium TaxID=2609290 RepID=UPI00097BED12|nr:MULTISPECIES: hypothetical protein [unclassified Microbacterium]MXS73729.1 hypothetical protein [Microbacterium sp. TL13]ONI62357.1 hypothetical protein CSIV_12685 [Microbacterium sp. CSI-V]
MTLVALADVPTVDIDPSALSSAAESLRTHADAATDSAERISSTWNTLPASYEAPEAGELLARMTVVPRAADDFADTARRVAAIMAQLADQLALARAQETSLRTEVVSFRDAVRGFRASSDDMGLGSSDDTWGPGQFLRNQELISECLSLRTLRDTAIEEARGDLASIGQPDVVLSTTGVVGARPSSSAWAAEYDAVADGVGFAILEKLSAGTADDARALLAAHDDWRRLFAANPPDATAVNAWWTQLTASNPGALDALVLGASVIVGSLGGVPPASRVAANAVNANNRIPAIEAAIQRMQDMSRGHGGPDYLAWKDVIGQLERQRNYLQRAADGDVQLYLYEPDSQSIIEMIGTLDENTTDVITYVPGTYTSVHSFYGDQVQQVGRWLQTNDPRTVTFVWKEGLFPGEDVASGGMDPSRILEANDEGAALEKGRLIADFQQELLSSSPEAASAQHDGMGHSWGLAGITSSEVAGAKYSQVHSLAGAGMPSGWTPSPTTEYLHWGYTDALSIMQGTGAVWDGRIPTREAAFASHVYGREGDFTLYLPTGTGSDTVVVSPQPPASIPLTTSPVANHNLIASDNPDNQNALFHMLREIER